MTAKWTIGIVNYKTSYYLKWQFKCLYQFNDPKDFKIVIVDNSRDEEEKQKLLAIAKPYQDQHNNLQIIFFNPTEKSASGQHGEGLTLILKEYADTPYILFQDPDFFWVKQNVLNWFESYLEKDKVAIGAPYPGKVGEGHPRFPCAYGCAHRVADIKHLDLMADASEEARQRSFTLFPIKDGWEFSYDVGWKLRQALSTADNHDNFVTIEDQLAMEIKEIIGRHSFETITRKYIYDGKIIAYHLFRGSFTGMVTDDQSDPNVLTQEEWLEARDKFGELLYSILQNDGELPFAMKKLVWKNHFHTFLRHSALSRIVRNLLKKSALGKSFVKFIKRKADLA